MISGKDFAEKCFSQVEESEKLFSTGNEELDSILEEVYYSGIEDGYDYAQKEFSSKLKLGTRLQNKFLEKKKLSNKEAIEEYTKMRDKAIKEGDEDEAEAWQSYIDGVMLNRGEMTEDEYIKKYPLTAKRKYRK